MISERRWDETGEEHFRETFRPPVLGSRARQWVHLLALTELDRSHASTIVLRRNEAPGGQDCEMRA